MTGRLTLHGAGPGLSVQDLGRPGQIANGLARGGAMDRRALLEATALLGRSEVGAALEMAGTGGVFTADQPTRIALTGAPMRAARDGTPLAWNATHLLAPGQRLEIGPVLAGSYGYLSLAGGLDAPAWLGSRAAHLTAGIGAPSAAGDVLAFRPDPAPDSPEVALPPDHRFTGGAIRLLDGPQSDLFPPGTRQRFFETRFRRAAQANRQGIRLDGASAPFQSAAEGLLSDFIGPGDVQMTGAGVPFVLMAECQTIGGYPRIGTVLPADLPRMAQTPFGGIVTFQPISLEDADRAQAREAETLARLRQRVQPLRRDPHQMRDLGSYQLISGVTSGDENGEGPK